MPKPPRAFDPRVIDSAPITPEIGALIGREDELLDNLAAASELLAEKDAEIDRLKGQRSVEDVRAGLMEGAASNVFRFIVVYCGVVGLFLALAGFRHRTGFELSDTILGIIAGSTAVSVIGLMGMVVTGIFGKTMPKPAAKRTPRKPAA